MDIEIDHLSSIARPALLLPPLLTLAWLQAIVALSYVTAKQPGSSDNRAINSGTSNALISPSAAILGRPTRSQVRKSAMDDGRVHRMDGPLNGSAHVKEIWLGAFSSSSYLMARDRACMMTVLDSKLGVHRPCHTVSSDQYAWIPQIPHIL